MDATLSPSLATILDAESKDCSFVLYHYHPVSAHARTHTHIHAHTTTATVHIKQDCDFTWQLWQRQSAGLPGGGRAAVPAG